MNNINFIPCVYDARSNQINGTFMNLGYVVSDLCGHACVFICGCLFSRKLILGIPGVDITCSSMRDFQIKAGIRRQIRRD